MYNLIASFEKCRDDLKPAQASQVPTVSKKRYYFAVAKMFPRLFDFWGYEVWNLLQVLLFCMTTIVCVLVCTSIEDDALKFVE